MAESKPEDDRVIAPTKITGAFLHCSHLTPPTPTDVSLGCEFKNPEGQTVSVDPSKVDVSVVRDNLVGVEISLRKADSTTAGIFAWIEARSTQVNVEETIKKAQINVQAAVDYPVVASRAYTVESVTEASVPVATSWGLAGSGQSCQAYCSSLSKSFDPQAMETRILKSSDPNAACLALIRELGTPAMNTGAFPNESSAGCAYSFAEDASAVANVSAPNDGNLSLPGCLQTCPCR